MKRSSPSATGLAPPADAPRSLYVHVPFCAHRCHYCDFSVATPQRPPIDAYLDALAVDLEDWVRQRSWETPLSLDTLFIGGGTPSLLGARGMRRLAELLRTRFRWDPDEVEWTAEANPSSLTDDVCRAWREIGVNRLSIGVQSFQDEPLEWLGRMHDGVGACEAVERAGAAGFTRLNIDLIFGLPVSVPRDWREDVGRALSLGVTHVSAYGLTAERRTPLGRRVEAGRVRMPDEDRYGDEYLEVSTRLREAGFRHYEVSNFARPGHPSRHNWHYWDGSEYLGLGPSSHSYLGGERIWNVYRWDRYRKAAAAGTGLREGRERPDAEARRLERIWLGLRTDRGLRLDRVSPAAQTRLAEWERAGWTSITDSRVLLTPEGWLRLDALASEIAGWSTDEILEPEMHGKVV